MREILECVGDGVIAVDTEFIRPRTGASHLGVDAGRAAMHAFIDRILEHRPTAADLTHYTVGPQA
jgi:hypothetical protein